MASSSKRRRGSSSPAQPVQKLAVSRNVSPAASAKDRVVAEATPLSDDGGDDLDADYFAWKSKVPLLYDAFVHHNLEWASLSVEWGPRGSLRGLRDDNRFAHHQVYLSARTDASYDQSAQVWDSAEASTLIVAEVAVPQRFTAPLKFLSKFTEKNKSSLVTEVKRIVHPGEVNRIRANPQDRRIVVTHSDSPVTFVWHTAHQRDRTNDARPHVPSLPDLCLVGHEAPAEYACAFAPVGHSVASGGSDGLVLAWSLLDAQGSLASAASSHPASASPAQLRALALSVRPRARLAGHTSGVEDVAWHPHAAAVLASVGRDRSLRIWDLRASCEPVASLCELHGDDINCLAWNPREPHLVATGASDALVKVVDLRRVRQGESPDPGGAVARALSGHTDSVTCVQWMGCDAGYGDFAPGVFRDMPRAPYADGGARFLASAGDDERIVVWDATAGDPEPSPVPAGRGDGQRPLFVHAGHRAKVVDFSFCPHDPWLCLSLSDDATKEDLGGGTLQMWRPTDLIRRGATRRGAGAGTGTDPARDAHRPPVPDPPPATAAAAATRSDAGGEKEGAGAAARAAASSGPSGAHRRSLPSRARVQALAGSKRARPALDAVASAAGGAAAAAGAGAVKASQHARRTRQPAVAEAAVSDDGAEAGAGSVEDSAALSGPSPRAPPRGVSADPVGGPRLRAAGGRRQAVTTSLPPSPGAHHAATPPPPPPPDSRAASPPPSSSSRPTRRARVAAAASDGAHGDGAAAAAGVPAAATPRRRRSAATTSTATAAATAAAATAQLSAPLPTSSSEVAETPPPADGSDTAGLLDSDFEGLIAASARPASPLSPPRVATAHEAEMSADRVGGVSRRLADMDEESEGQEDEHAGRAAQAGEAAGGRAGDENEPRVRGAELEGEATLAEDAAAATAEDAAAATAEDATAATAEDAVAATAEDAAAATAEEAAPLAVGPMDPKGLAAVRPDDREGV